MMAQAVAANVVTILLNTTLLKHVIIYIQE